MVRPRGMGRKNKRYILGVYVLVLFSIFQYLLLFLIHLIRFHLARLNETFVLKGDKFTDSKNWGQNHNWY